MEILFWLERVLWSGPLLAILMGSHLYFTGKLRFIQRHTIRGIRLSLDRDKSDTGVSGFGALSASLAAAIGTGNIIGVATAVALGGPGAVFWCWLTGVLGMATRYAETVTVLRHPAKDGSGKPTGGAMYVLRDALHRPGLGRIFAILGVLTAILTGSMIQSNAIALSLHGALGLPNWLSGLLTAALALPVILGGKKRIAGACQVLVPMMAGLYLLGCLGLLLMHRAFLTEAFLLILRSAFLPRAAGGGFVGSTVITAARYGVARGLFTNEAGMGTAPMTAAAAPCRSPQKSALAAMTAVFWDTAVICALTGLVLVSSILAAPDRFAAAGPGELCALAFSALPLGSWVLTVSLVTFAFATVVGWCWYGETCWEFLRPGCSLFPFRLGYILAAWLGAAVRLTVLWSLGGILAGAMAIPNLISLFSLRREIAGKP